MQIDIIFQELEQKYGEDFPWFLVQPDSSFLHEAYREISKNHPLSGMKLTCLAKCGANDDVLFLTEHGQFAVIHLTYCETNAPGYPIYKLFDTHLEVRQYLEQWSRM